MNLRSKIILTAFFAASILLYALCTGAMGQYPFLPARCKSYTGRAGQIQGNPLLDANGLCPEHAAQARRQQDCPPGTDCSVPPVWARVGTFGHVTVAPGKVTVRGGLGGASVGMSPVVRSASVVPIFFGEGDDTPGAGVYVGVIRGRGVTITAGHMAEYGVRRVLSTPPTGVSRDKLGYDLAAVMTRPLTIAPAVLASEARIGEAVTISGYPRGRSGSRRSRVIGFFLPESGQAWGDLKLAGSSAPGDSGGAITDTNGQIVGMLWGTVTDDSNISAAVSVTAIADFLRRVDVMLGEMDANGSGGSEVGTSQSGTKSPAPSGNIISGGLPVDSARPGAGGDGAIPSGVADRFDRLETLIAANAVAIHAVASSAPKDGGPGERGADGKSATIDYDKIVAEAVKRLPPMQFEMRNADGSITTILGRLGGAPVSLELVPVERK